MEFENQTLDYLLPPEKIASFPLEVRHNSKLLVYKNKTISHDQFIHVANHLATESLLVFNNTKVFQARLHFYTEKNKPIEVFCLEPANGEDPAKALATVGYSEWICMVGGAKKWKSGKLTYTFNFQNNQEITIEASLVVRKDDLFHIAFKWQNTSISFAEILENSGELPLPPYMNRKATQEDKLRYQTVYAKYEGSVAAPTAGLHFTEKVMQLLNKKNIHTSFVTLHVGAGTFKPIKTDNYTEHEMHHELLDVSLDHIKQIIEHLGKIIVVGTTSLRTIESLYWLGVKIFLNEKLLPNELNLNQWEAYELPQEMDAVICLEALAQWMKNNSIKRLVCKTQIMITPGYQLKVAEGLITNFHQPRSTLLLIIAAFTGKDWEKIYQEALENNYRFLSYGDSSLLMKR